MKKRWSLVAVAGALAAAALWHVLRPLPPRPTQVLIWPGIFRGHVLCETGFERACELMFRPGGGLRDRVIVWLDGFLADTTLVTRKQYEACRAKGACTARQPPSTDLQLAWKYTHRLAFVSVEGAQEYCRARGWRLPTGDEFERLYRWTDGRRYPWGNQECNRDCDERASPDGVRELALHDFSGGEWIVSPSGALGQGESGGDGNEVRDLSADDVASEPEYWMSPFRCVQSLLPGPNPGQGVVLEPFPDDWIHQGGRYQ